MKMSKMFMPTEIQPFVSIHKYRVGRFFLWKIFTIKNKKYK